MGSTTIQPRSAIPVGRRVSYAEELRQAVRYLRDADGKALADAKLALLNFLPRDIVREGCFVHLPHPELRKELYDVVSKILRKRYPNSSSERIGAAIEIVNDAIISDIPEVSVPMIRIVADCLLEEPTDCWIDARNVLREAAISGDQKVRGRIIGTLKKRAENYLGSNSDLPSYLYRMNLLFKAIKDRINQEFK